MRFRVWAPFADVVHVEADGARHAMEPEERGYHAVTVDDAGPGTRYCFAPDGGVGLFPIPRRGSSRTGSTGPRRWSRRPSRRERGTPPTSATW